MGSSFIRYRHEGFWARDCQLIEFAALFCEIGAFHRLSSQRNMYSLRDAIDIEKYYIDLSKGLVGMGCLSLWLDDLAASTEDARLYVLQVQEIAKHSDATEELRVNLLDFIISLLTGSLSSRKEAWEGQIGFRRHVFLHLPPKLNKQQIVFLKEYFSLTENNLAIKRKYEGVGTQFLDEHWHYSTIEVVVQRFKSVGLECSIFVCDDHHCPIQ